MWTHTHQKSIQSALESGEHIKMSGWRHWKIMIDVITCHTSCRYTSTQIFQHAGPSIIIFTTISPTNNTQRVRTEPKACQGFSKCKQRHFCKWPSPSKGLGSCVLAYSGKNQSSWQTSMIRKPTRLGPAVLAVWAYWVA